MGPEIHADEWEVRLSGWHILIPFTDIIPRQSCAAGRQKDSLSRWSSVTKTLVLWLCSSGYITPCICRSRKTLEHRSSNICLFTITFRKLRKGVQTWMAMWEYYVVTSNVHVPTSMGLTALHSLFLRNRFNFSKINHLHCIKQRPFFGFWSL